MVRGTALVKGRCSLFMSLGWQVACTVAVAVAWLLAFAIRVQHGARLTNAQSSLAVLALLLSHTYMTPDKVRCV
jgi:hypothetical protein